MKIKTELLKKWPQISVSTDRVLLASSALILVLFLLFSIWGEDGLLRLMELKNLRNQIASENKDILLNNLNHLQEIHNLKQVSSIEQVARSEMGLIRQDEVVLIFDESTHTPPTQ